MSYFECFSVILMLQFNFTKSHENAKRYIFTFLFLSLIDLVQVKQIVKVPYTPNCSKVVIEKSKKAKSKKSNKNKLACNYHSLQHSTTHTHIAEY